MLITAVAALAAAFPAPHDQSDWRDFIVTPDQVVYSGVITGPVVRRIEAALKGRRRTLRIASQGGAIDAGLDLAEFVSARQIKVVANRYCFSACASYVLAASPEPTLEGPVLLGFHNTDSAMAVVMMARQSSRNTPLITRLEDQAKREQELYRKARIDPALLYAPLAELRPICSFEVELKGRQGGGVKAGAQTLWTPDRETLAAYGLHLRGGEAALFSTVRAHYNESWARHLSALTLLSAKAPAYHPTSLGAAQAMLAAVPRC